MANEVKLPRLGQGMESGTITKWLKSEGDKIEKGEPLYELDTDKVTQEVEADFSGVLLKIAINEGEVEVGKTIAVIGEKGEEVDATDADTEETGPKPTATKASEDGAEQSAEKPAKAPKRDPERKRGRAASAEPDEQETEIREPEPAARGDGGRVKASPLARRIARERGIDLAGLTGTGPEGRVVAEDVERAAATPGAAPSAAPAAAPPEEVQVEQLSSIRKTIARRLTQAWEAPAFQISMSADMTAAQEVRERLLDLHDTVRPTVSDLLTKLCAVALMRHRQVNAHFVDDSIQLYPTANIGLAVASERGLVVPVIPGCERKSVAEIAAARSQVVERARSGKLQQADLEGGTFTISNLGMYGVEHFIAVLNPPQVAILAVGAIEQKPVVEGGAVVVQPRMELTLTCDHRAVDGSTAAEFLATVKSLLELPALAL